MDLRHLAVILVAGVMSILLITPAASPDGRWVGRLVSSSRGMTEISLIISRDGNADELVATLWTSPPDGYRYSLNGFFDKATGSLRLESKDWLITGSLQGLFRDHLNGLATQLQSGRVFKLRLHRKPLI